MAIRQLCWVFKSFLGPNVTTLHLHVICFCVVNSYFYNTLSCRGASGFNRKIESLLNPWTMNTNFQKLFWHWEFQKHPAGEHTFQSTQLLYNLNRCSSEPFSHKWFLSNTNHRGGRVERQQLSHALSHFSLNCQRAKPFITPAFITPETATWIELSPGQTLLSSCGAFTQKSNVTLWNTMS